jgi:phosphopantothenoylcysteine decarboxylase/phosphopantothenate--cysteine ligase
VNDATPLAGRRVVVSAGPTFEDIDPVRYIGNRSSGKMGFAIAEAAARAGADVALVAGPVHLPTPPGVRRTDVRSAAQLRDAVLAALPADAYVGAAAVADWTPRDVAPHKLKKRDGQDTLSIELVRTPDVLAEVASHATLRPRLVVGFAAETEHLEANARAKLERKRVDLVAANLVGVRGSGFEADDNALAVFARDGATWQLGPASKRELANAFVQLIAERLA